MARTSGIASEFELVSGPVNPILTSTELKRHLKVDDSERDDDITAFLSAAAERLQRDTRRQLITATYKLHLPAFPHVIQIRKCPVQSITSIVYRDTNNQSQTLSTNVYESFLTREPAEIHLKFSQVWPVTYTRDQAVEITFVAGYGDAASDVPDTLKSAAKLIVEGMFYGHEEELEPTIERLINLYNWGI